MREYQIQSETLIVKFLDLGGRITCIKPAFYGENLVLSYPETFTGGGAFSHPNQAYEDDKYYLGALIGRFANRIAGGTYERNGVLYRHEKNDAGKNLLHSGKDGYHARRFDVACSHSRAVLRLRDKEGPFPGNVDVTVTYMVLGGSLILQYKAKTDKDTVINLTNHTYFDPKGDINDLEVLFHAQQYTPVDEHRIPTGEIKNVAGSVFDFTKGENLGAMFARGGEILAPFGGYDHNFVLPGKGLRRFAEIYMPKPDITLSAFTDLPGFQFYTGNFLDAPFTRRQGFCLETQFFPDSPNQKNFPPAAFTPEKAYSSKTIYTFTAGKA